MPGADVDQLKKQYSDTEWRRKYVDYCDLMEILGDSIIPDNYAVPDDLNQALKLSEAGNSMVDKLTRKEKVNAKDARMMCALTIGHVDLFVDIDELDIDKLSDAVNRQLAEKAIRFPFIHGRALYDAYAELHEDEKESLSNEETIRLLDKLPEGVFQYGRFTLGPFGLRRSPASRSISASRRVAAYHCSTASCQVVHWTTLQTGHYASVNRDRDKLDSILQSSEEDSAEWWALAADLGGYTDSYYGDQRAGVLLPLVGDTLSEVELKLLVTDLFDRSRGELRETVKPFLEVKSAGETTAGMSRAQLLQLVLLTREDYVAASLDKLVADKMIEVPHGEVRRPVINRTVRSGAFGLRAELGHRGVRFISDDPGLALLRQRRLLGKLYLSEPESETIELEWQLRGIEIDDLTEKLEHFYRSRSPEDALRRLVLARRSNMVTACHEVGIDHGTELTDEELLETIMWKLGFPSHAEEDPHAPFWSNHERLWALTQSSSIGSSDRFMEAAAPYFTYLEGLLLDSLAFTSWALLTDHTSGDSPFTYDDHEDRAGGLALLQSASEGILSGARKPDFAGEKVELRNLIEGYRVLAKHLGACIEAREQYRRPTDEFPGYDGKTDLKRFALRSTVPFLDLSAPSQERIIDGLTKIATSMDEAEVFHVRNDYAHYRRVTPDISRMERALEAIRQSVTRIENLGFCRILFTPTTVTKDEWGQKRHDFSGPRSYEHAFSRPTNLDWMGLPRLNEAQHLLRAASFGDPSEVLRFTRRYRSEFSSMWRGVPNRRRGGANTAAVEDETGHGAGVEMTAERG